MTSSPYIPTTAADRQAMLDAIGVRDIEALFHDIPAAVRNPHLDLPPAMSEMEVRAHLQALAAKNRNLGEMACFLGAGAYRHYIPSIVWDLAKRSEFLTAYTPYQPEISQGVLQGLYEYQSLLCLLTGMEAANTGMYDGATAMAEAVLMACRLTGRNRVALRDTVSPAYRQVVATYAEPQGIRLVRAADSPGIEDDTACLVVQSPNFFGYMENLKGMSVLTHTKGALLVASIDPTSLGMFRPPSDYNADIVVGEGQPLGVPLSFGGPYLGLFACKNEHLRQMPGRIVGRTVDVEGKTGYVLTLQTREQHIRRERATSNICTSESLVALAASIYLAALGKAGLRQVAELCYQKAHYAAERIAVLPGYSLPIQGTFFQEFTVQCPAPPSEINAALREHGILGGLDISAVIPRAMLLCATEMNTRAQIDALVEGLAAFSPRRDA